MIPTPAANEIARNVRDALREDLGAIGRDYTAELINAECIATATLISREAGVLCGQAWVNEVFQQLGGKVELTWHKAEGDVIAADDILLTMTGPARSILTGERTAMNLLQTLSGTATVTSQYAEQLHDSTCQLLDTRKTIPGLRLAQKYAVAVGGGHNHRIGLFDAFLIKENHIAAAGSIAQAVRNARQLNSDLKLEVEVETLAELEQAIAAKVDVIMLDNFSLTMMTEAVTLVRALDASIKLEASGDVTLETLATIATTGVDYISVGALTKHVRALDLSLRVNVQ
ncbi:MAG: carboxylating nicotinate-nucleotide diphosphorylase [Gammaproteobacteria bacterium]|nr:carboxylating nicotinate-nucleotide diphosphorylase [Gammaproteobacteria bacterium]